MHSFVERRPLQSVADIGVLLPMSYSDRWRRVCLNTSEASPINARTSPELAAGGRASAPSASSVARGVPDKRRPERCLLLRSSDSSLLACAATLPLLGHAACVSTAAETASEEKANCGSQLAIVSIRLQREQRWLAVLDQFPQWKRQRPFYRRAAALRGRAARGGGRPQRHLHAGSGALARPRPFLDQREDAGSWRPHPRQRCDSSPH